MEQSTLFYWELEEAVCELKRRQQDMALQRKIDAILGDCPIPAGLNGFLARHIATCRLEDIQFLERCHRAGLSPFWLEYVEDKFAITNPSKMRLTKIRVVDGFGRNGGPRTRLIRLIKDPGIWAGRLISGIKTDAGENLVDFHHRLRHMIGWNDEIIILEVSSWLKELGEAEDYYEYLLLAMVTRGIFFESFESVGFPNLGRFKNQIVIPAWNWIVEEGFPIPLIVLHPDCPPEKEEIMLNCYPAPLLAMFNLNRRKLKLPPVLLFL